jgi:hypothetical protein
MKIVLVKVPSAPHKWEVVVSGDELCGLCGQDKLRSDRLLAFISNVTRLIRPYGRDADGWEPQRPGSSKKAHEALSVFTSIKDSDDLPCPAKVGSPQPFVKDEVCTLPQRYLDQHVDKVQRPHIDLQQAL